MFYPVIATVRAAVVQWCLPQLFLQSSGRQPVAAQTPHCSHSRALSLSRLKFGAQNANTIKCWVIALTWKEDNWEVSWQVGPHYHTVQPPLIYSLSLAGPAPPVVRNNLWLDMIVWCLMICYWFCTNSAFQLEGIMWSKKNDSTTFSLPSIKDFCLVILTPHLELFYKILHQTAANSQQSNR